MNQPSNSIVISLKKYIIGNSTGNLIIVPQQPSGRGVQNKTE